METLKIYRRFIPKKVKNFLWVFFWHTKIFFRHFFRHIEASINYLLHNRDVFENELIIITTLKDEVEYLKEWIEYHKIIGVEKFYIYDNESSDNLKEFLQPYIDSGEVVYTYYPGNYAKIQIKVIEEALRKYRNKAKWIALIDIDEYIVPVTKDNILDAIAEIEHDLKRKIHALAINWVMYGYSGHKTRPGGLLIEKFTKHAGVDRHVKSIINPRMISQPCIHHDICLFGIPERTEKGIAVREGKLQNLSDVSIEKIRVNHYYTKSYEESVEKIKKYRAFLKIEDETLPEFDPNYLSNFEDNIMEKYISRVKEAVS